LRTTEIGVTYVNFHIQNTSTMAIRIAARYLAPLPRFSSSYGTPLRRTLQTAAAANHARVPEFAFAFE
jgi:broad specificity phosphatase PhoE